MLAACRLAGLSVLEGHYAGVSASAQCAACGRAARFFWVSANGAAPSQTPASLTPRPVWREKQKLAGNSRLGDDGVATSLGSLRAGL